MQENQGENTIYIPLCFYFIGVFRSFNSQICSDLHSTMLLLYHCFRPLMLTPWSDLHSTMLLLYLCSARAISWSYWLFTFHYASTLSESKFHKKISIANLHSTMLLLYRGIRYATISSIRFTFHYASTLSSLLMTIWNSIFIFTFHYASTLSMCRYRQGSHGPNLHSTMLLLYLIQDRISRSLRLYLHSTMLLLYRCKQSLIRYAWC